MEGTMDNEVNHDVQFHLLPERYRVRFQSVSLDDRSLITLWLTVSIGLLTVPGLQAAAIPPDYLLLIIIDQAGVSLFAKSLPILPFV